MTTGATEVDVPSRALVIQVVSCETTEATRAAYAASDPRSDLVELRLDGVRDLDLEHLLAARGKPKLITVRSRQQGGGARRSEREAILRTSSCSAGLGRAGLAPGRAHGGSQRRAACLLIARGSSLA